jgi:hypothetical protein
MWHIGRSDEDFGQTLGHWGSGPWCYLVLPVFGPSSGRDAVGKVVDTPLDACFWIGVAYSDEAGPQCIRPGFGFNDMSADASDFKRELDSYVDPYQVTRTLYSLNRQRLILNYRPPGGEAFNPNSSLRYLAFKPVTPGFAERAVTRRVLMPATGKKLPYSCWMQKQPAPLVCYIPGLGGCRLDRSTLAYADLMYRHGYSVMAISSPFHKEFMERASTMAVPGYAPADCDDTVNALALILQDVRRWKGDRITGTSLTGVSHGAYFTLMVAARDAAGSSQGLGFDRYVAVNPPVQLVRAAQHLDDMFDAPLAWPAEARRKRMEGTLYKALYFDSTGLDFSGNIPLTRTESDYLIGLSFRYTLMSAIMDSQRRHNLGVLRCNPRKFARQESYREIRQISYSDFADRFVIPYLIETGRITNRTQVNVACDLKQYTGLFQHNPKIRVQISEDDFLLSPQDVNWFQATFGPHLKDYHTGGHLGNLYLPEVQEALVQMYSNQSDEHSDIHPSHL